MKLMHIWVLNCISFAIFVQVIAHSSAACVWQYTSVLSGSKNKPHWWCRALKYDTLFSLSLQPLDMNSVELAQHNLSARPPPPPRREPPFFQTIAPAAAAGALKKKRRRRRSQDGRPKLWHLLITFSCGVEALVQTLL